MNTTVVQVIRWITRIVHAFIAAIWTILFISNLFPVSFTRIDPLGYLTFASFLFSTKLAYTREGFAGVLILVVLVVQSIDLVFTLRGELAFEVLFRGILEQSIPFLFIGAMYIICWWQSKNLQGQDVV